jgi:hypothetical protein
MQWKDDDALEIDRHYDVIASFSARSLRENTLPAGLDHRRRLQPLHLPLSII